MQRSGRRFGFLSRFGVAVICSMAVASCATQTTAPGSGPDNSDVLLKRNIILPTSRQPFDDLSPMAVMAASDGIVEGEVVANGPDRWSYTVSVDKVFFTSFGLAPRTLIPVDGDRFLPLPPRARLVLSLTAENRLGPNEHQLTQRILSAGEVRNGELTYRSVHGTIRYDATHQTAPPGCFFVGHPEPSCRDKLLAGFGITTKVQRQVYDTLLHDQPESSLLWMVLYARTREPFPTRLCTNVIHTECASHAAFIRRVGFRTTASVLPWQPRKVST